MTNSAKDDQQAQLDKELVQAQAALDSATEEYEIQLQIDLTRSQGSGAQDARHEERLDRLKNKQFHCQRLVEELKSKK